MPLPKRGVLTDGGCANVRPQQHPAVGKRVRPPARSPGPSPVLLAATCLITGDLGASVYVIFFLIPLYFHIL